MNSSGRQGRQAEGAERVEGRELGMYTVIWTWFEDIKMYVQ